MLLLERYQFGVDVGIGSISDLRIFPIRRSERKECVARGSCSTLYTLKVLDEEKCIFINRREKGRENETKKIPNGLFGRIFLGRVNARRERQNGNFLIRPN